MNLASHITNPQDLGVIGLPLIDLRISLGTETYMHGM